MLVVHTTCSALPLYSLLPKIWTHFLASESFLYMQALFTVDLNNETHFQGPVCLLCRVRLNLVSWRRGKGGNSSQQLYRTELIKGPLWSHAHWYRVYKGHSMFKAFVLCDRQGWGTIKKSEKLIQETGADLGEKGSHRDDDSPQSLISIRLLTVRGILLGLKLWSKTTNDIFCVCECLPCQSKLISSTLDCNHQYHNKGLLPELFSNSRRLFSVDSRAFWKPWNRHAP